MIQRIQTIWLLISAIAPAYLFKGPLVRLTGDQENIYLIGFKGINNLSESGQILLHPSIAIPLLVVLIPLISVIAIFLYKRRAVQKVISLVIFTLSLCLIVVGVYQSWQLVKEFQAILHFGPGLIIPPLSCIASLLAYRGISRDDNLVKSYERLR